MNNLKIGQLIVGEVLMQETTILFLIIAKNKSFDIALGVNIHYKLFDGFRLFTSDKIIT